MPTYDVIVRYIVEADSPADAESEVVLADTDPDWNLHWDEIVEVAEYSD